LTFEWYPRFPGNLPAEVYTDLANGPIRGYQQFNMDNRDEDYYSVFTWGVEVVDLFSPASVRTKEHR